MRFRLIEDLVFAIGLIFLASSCQKDQSRGHNGELSPSPLQNLNQDFELTNSFVSSVKTLNGTGAEYCIRSLIQLIAAQGLTTGFKGVAGRLDATFSIQIGETCLIHKR